jgi:hypothetical protein
MEAHVLYPECSFIDFYGKSTLVPDLRKEHHITVENFKLEVKDITCGGGDGEFT